MEKNKINIDVAKSLRYILTIVKTNEFKTFLFVLTFGLTMCFGLKKLEVYGTKLADRYNQK